MFTGQVMRQLYQAAQCPVCAIAGTVLTFDVLNRYNTYSFGGAKASLQLATLSTPVVPPCMR